MPTYQYACTDESCGVKFERVQSFTDAAITDCPECAGRVRKVYGSVGVVFKGSGFYRNDSRDTKSGGATSSSNSSSSSSGSDGSGSSSTADKPTASGSSAPKSDAAPATKSGASQAKAASTAAS